jgi:hypothetical protein
VEVGIELFPVGVVLTGVVFAWMDGGFGVLQ